MGGLLVESDLVLVQDAAGVVSLHDDAVPCEKLLITNQDTQFVIIIPIVSGRLSANHSNHSVYT